LQPVGIQVQNHRISTASHLGASLGLLALALLGRDHVADLDLDEFGRELVIENELIRVRNLLRATPTTPPALGAEGGHCGRAQSMMAKQGSLAIVTQQLPWRTRNLLLNNAFAC
jgi:hypothetical protein